jgi:hypothetical protein
MYKILKTLDVKTWIILILTALLVLGIIFRPSKKIDYYKDEINKQKNLLKKNYQGEVNKKKHTMNMLKLEKNTTSN